MESKFKAKAVNSGNWVYGYHTLKFVEFDYTGKKDIIEFYDKLGYFHSIIVDPKTLCRFTGCKDKKNNEIYEFDQVILNGHKCLITFSDTFGGWEVSYPCRDDVDIAFDRMLYYHYEFNTPDIEVIGNMFENGETKKEEVADELDFSCPHCGSDDIDVMEGNMDVLGHYVSEFMCYECKGKFEHTYTLTLVKVEKK